MAFAASALLHLVVILLYHSSFATPEVRFSPRSSDAPTRIEGIELIRLVDPPEAEELSRPEAPEEREARQGEPLPAEPAAAPEEDEPAGERTADATEGGMTAAERVRGTIADPRLLVPLPEEVVALSDQQIAELRIRWLIEEINDSTSAAAEALASAQDWTYTTEDGKRWGISPEGIHLGDITLPLPAFGSAYDPDAWKGSMDADLARAVGSAIARATNEERAKVIRERLEEERRERRAREEKSDTTVTEGGGGAG